MILKEIHLLEKGRKGKKFHEKVKLMQKRNDYKGERICSLSSFPAAEAKASTNICPPPHLSLLACTVASLHHKSLVGEILPFQHFCPANSAEGTQAALTRLLSSTRSHLPNKRQRLHRLSSCPVAGTALRPTFPLARWWHGGGKLWRAAGRGGEEGRTEPSRFCPLVSGEVWTVQAWANSVLVLLEKMK